VRGTATRTPKEQALVRPNALSTRGARYAFALVLVAAATGARILCDPIFGTEAPYLFHLFAVIVVAWTAGTGPGVLATVAGAAAVSFFIIPPRGEFTWTWHALGPLIFSGLGLVLAWQGGRWRNAELVVRRNEGELREISQRLAYHVNHSPLAVIEFGPDMRLTRWTGAAERLFGWTAGEVLGKTMHEFRWVYDEDTGKVDRVSSELRTGTNPQQFSVNRNYRKDGSVVMCEWYNSSLVDADGKLRSILSLVLDVTERMRLEGELREQAARLASANRLKDQFLATLSHELRTPVNAILGWSQIIMADTAMPPERLRRGIETISRNALLQVQLIGDLLDVSQIVAGHMRLALKNVDLAMVAEQALDAIRPEAAKKPLTIVANIEPGLAMRGDRLRLQQVIWNLLSNAVKFTPEGGTVTLSARRTNPDVEIEVRDTGIGIDADFLPFVFDRFRQADSSSTRVHAGLGLGLAIVRHIAELHGGRVTAHSDGKGRGTVITVRLPIDGPPSA
jgi:PAS domain S-box-containing protein